MAQRPICQRETYVSGEKSRIFYATSTKAKIYFSFLLSLKDILVENFNFSIKLSLSARYSR